MRRRRLLAALSLAGAAVAGCPRGETAETGTGGSPGTGDDTPTSGDASGGATPSPQSPVTPAATPGPAGGSGVAYTHVQPTGNRVLAGRGSIPDVTPVEYETDGRPAWLAALPRESGTGSAWAVATADGTVRLLAVDGSEVADDRRLGTTPPGAPFALADDPDTHVVERPADAARWSHPVPVGDGRSLYVDGDGGVVLDGETTERVGVGALPDARIVRVSAGRYALLGGRTDRYGHGALGDSVEAGTVVLADVRDGLSVETVLELDGSVLEGIAPVAADLTGDGERELIVTVSDAERGARHVVLDAGGERLATGPDFGTGFRWRHALAVGPFGPGGEVEFAAVETPHVGGTARFHRTGGDRLEVVAGVGGVSSHAIGSRNLDGGLGGDLDGDGRWELLVPTQRRDELVGIRRSGGGAEVAWRVPLPGELASNVTGVTLPGGGLAVGAAGTDGVVRIWHP